MAPSRPSYSLVGLPALALVLLVSAALPAPALAAVPEYDVKAALIYKMSKFIRWPATAFAGSGGTLRLCIVGRDDFGASIDGLQGQKIQGQQLAVERLARTDASLANCHIVFIGRSERARLTNLLGALAGLPALTVSDIDGFAAEGGMVGFATHEGKLSFQINPTASTRAGLQVGAQLLQLATLVDSGRPEVRP